MLRDGLVAETAGDYRQAAMTENVEAGMLRTTLRLTAAGHVAIGREPPVMTQADIDEELDLQQAALDRENGVDAAAQAAQGGAGGVEAPAEADAPDSPRVPPSPAGLRKAAMAVLAAWDDEANRARRRRPTRAAGGSSPMRNLAPLPPPASRARAPSSSGAGHAAPAGGRHRRPGRGGHRLGQPHTVRGFFAGLKKRRASTSACWSASARSARNKAGAKGSYTIYRVAEAALMATG